MDEEKIKKPLLSYEQVEDIIDQRISCEEEEETLDERIVRIEKAAEKLKSEYKEMRRCRPRRRRKKRSFLGRLWERLLQCFRR